MFAIQLVEVAVIGRVMLGTVPPVPVATFRNQQFLPGESALLGRNPMRMAVIIIASFGQKVPGTVVFRGPDPDIEVGIDPRSRNHATQLPKVAFLVPGDGLADSDRLDLRVALQPIVKASQEFAP